MAELNLNWTEIHRLPEKFGLELIEFFLTIVTLTFFVFFIIFVLA